MQETRFLPSAGRYSTKMGKKQISSMGTRRARIYSGNVPRDYLNLERRSKPSAHDPTATTKVTNIADGGNQKKKDQD